MGNGGCKANGKEGVKKKKIYMSMVMTHLAAASPLASCV